MESPSGIDLHCYEDMRLFMHDVSIDIPKYHTILSYIPDSELQNYCKYLNIPSANVAPRADLENEILGFRENLCSLDHDTIKLSVCTKTIFPYYT
tara:strand:+ start:5057 stop:5341 length:285 start_codon:yes stop_codon:yes gene_type:complete